MTKSASIAFTQWYCEGRLGSYVRSRKSPGRMLDMVELARPGGEFNRPALPDLILYQDMQGGSRISGDCGGGYFHEASEKGTCFLSAPDFPNTIHVTTYHQTRGMAFPKEHWQSVIEEASDGKATMEGLSLYKGSFSSPALLSKLRNIWALCDEEGTPSRLMARAAGCEILAELFRLNGSTFAPAKGGLAPWAERRCMELMRARLAEDISLDELAAEAQLSAFHFARMFKQSVGLPPRAYLTQLRVEKARELLEHTDLPVTEIAFEVGYSSNQVLARVFLKHQHMSPTDYRRAVRDPARSLAQPSFQ